MIREIDITVKILKNTGDLKSVKYSTYSTFLSYIEIPKKDWKSARDSGDYKVFTMKCNGMCGFPIYIKAETSIGNGKIIKLDVP